MRTVLVILALVGLVTVGCEKSEEEPAGGGGMAANAAYDDGKLVKKFQGEGFGVKPKGIAVKPAEDAVYFAIKDVGVVRLDDNGFMPLSGLGDGYFLDMWVGPDGAAYVAGWGIHRLTADGAEPVATREQTGRDLLDAGAVGPDGRVAAVDSQRLHLNDGKKWKTWSHEDIGLTDGSLKDAAIDGDGNVWLLDWAGLWVLPAGEEKFKAVWDSSQLGEDSREFFESVELLEDGNLVLTGGGDLFFYNGESLEKRDLKDLFSVDGMHPGPGGYFIEAFRDVKLVDAENLEVQKSFKLKKSLGNIEDMSVDRQGRTWILTESGLVMLDKEMKGSHFKAGSLPALSGDLQAVVAVGKGTSGMPKAGRVARGVIQGKVFKGNSPAGGVTVELCPSPSSMFKMSPCEDAGFKRKAITEDDGSFQFKDVPLNAYGVAAHVGGKWSATMGSGCSGMQEGDVCDFGELVVD